MLALERDTEAKTVGQLDLVEAVRLVPKRISARMLAYYERFKTH